MQLKIQADDVALLLRPPEYSGMSKRGPYKKAGHKPPPPHYRRTFLAKWRDHRGMTQEELAEAAGVSIGTVSGIESGDSGYSDKSLSSLAKALKVTPGMIIDVDPTQNETLWSLIVRADADERAQIAKHAAVIITDKRKRK